MLITVISQPSSDPSFQSSLNNLKSLKIVKDVILWRETKTLSGLLEEVDTEFFLVFLPKGIIRASDEALLKLVQVSRQEKAGIVYSDYFTDGEQKRLCEYLPGSLRDDFDFGALMLFSTHRSREVLKSYPKGRKLKYGELYDLRLRLSERYPIIHLKSPSYEMIPISAKDPKEEIFSYVDPKNFEYQKEMESVFTEYLKRIGAYIPSYALRTVDEEEHELTLSIIIPVKDREKTIAQALESAISQKTDFPFNIIVVDNHSKDKTGEIVLELSRKYPNIIRLVPKRKDLGIGGCWNEAIFSRFCGRYAVQLDSDDLYSREDALQIIVDKFREGKYAMVVGSYMTVDWELNPIYPGIVDHREWSDDNGHNNLLRVSGIGAPRAFDTKILRRMPFKNLSYGEDYELSLRISREYRVGRIFDVLYLARRWEGGTDHGADEERMLKLNEIKDSIRSEELLERIEYVKNLNLN